MTQIKNTSFFQPPLISGCQLWLDSVDPAGTGIQPANGATVSTWIDKATGKNAVSGGASIPTFTNNSILFNGNGQYDTSYSTILTNESFFIVYKWDTISSDAFLIWGSSGNQRIYYVSSSSSRWLYLGGIAAWGRWSTNALTSNVRYLGEFTTNMTVPEVNLYLNGSALSSLSGINSPTPFSGSPTTSRIGTGHVGEINEIIGFNVTLTTAQRQQIEGYLAWKWGLQQSLPSTHPFARTPSFATALYFPKAVPKVTGTSGKHPVSIAGLQLWLDAADTSSMTLSGSTVTQWRDKSGNGNNSTSCSATYTGGINGLGSMNNPVISGPIANSGSSTVNIFVIASNNRTGNLYDNMLALNVSPITNYYASGSLFLARAGDNTNPQIYYAFMNGFPNGDLVATFSAAFNTAFMFNVFQTGTTGTTYGNGIDYGSLTTRGATFNYTNYYIGTCTGGPAWIGNIAEVLVFNAVLTTSQRQEIEGYLATKWALQSSLAAGHPYKTVVPIVIPYVNPVVRTSNNIRFSPTSIGGCQLWLDAADATSITGTTTVTQWRDKSGNSRHLGALSGTTSYSSNTIQLTNSAMSVSSPVNLTNVIVFIIVKTTGGNNQTVFGGRPNTNVNWSSPDGFGFYMDHQSFIRYYGGEDAAGRTLSFSANTSIPRLFSFQTIGTSVSGRMNGTSQSTGILSSARTSTAQGFVLGGEWNGSSYGNFIVNASIYEIIVYNSEISIAQLQQVEGYLAWKWALQTSLPTSHLYYKFPAGP